MLIELAMALTLAGAAGPQDDATVLSDVIVSAPPSQQRALRFIDRVAAPPTGRRLARWRRELCVSVAGLDAAYGQFILNRVNAVGISVGLEPGAPGCTPHVLVIFTADPDGAADRMIEEDLNVFRPTRWGATDRGAEALAAFRTSDAPVRWWHVSAPVSVLTGEIVVAMNGDTEPVVSNAPNASRLGANSREELQRAVVIVDTTRLGDVSFGALGEYIGMVALAQIEPDGDTSGYPTILNLFAGSPGQRISDWDQDYLQALYHARGDRFRYVQQASDMAERMAERISQRQDDPDAETSTN